MHIHVYKDSTLDVCRGRSSMTTKYEPVRPHCGPISGSLSRQRLFPGLPAMRSRFIPDHLSERAAFCTRFAVVTLQAKRPFCAARRAFLAKVMRPGLPTAVIHPRLRQRRRGRRHRPTRVRPTTLGSCQGSAGGDRSASTERMLSIGMAAWTAHVSTLPAVQ